MTLISLGPVELGLAAALVLLLAGLALWLALGLAQSLLVAVVRATLQLLLLGLILESLFELQHLGLIAGLALLMLAVAGREVMVRQTRRLRGLWGYGLGTGAMFLSSFTIALLALTVIIQPSPWYTPQYAIPLLGMLLGNTMNGVTLGLERITEGVAQQRAAIEARLALGQHWWQAVATMRRTAARQGMIPIINAMAAAGVVSLPGMMTGQILAGAAPLEAVKYQVLIFFLIVAGTGFGVITAVWLGARRLFDERDRLRLDRLHEPKSMH